MRRQIIVMFCSLFCFALQAALADDDVSSTPAQPNRGALFKITQDGHTLYLFGTIHVGAPDFYPLEARVTTALNKAQTLALEVDPLGDPANIAQAVQRYGMYQHGALASHLPAEYQPRLDKLLQHYSIPPAAVAGMKPWLLASVLTVSEFAAQGYDASLAVDAHLSKQAHAHHVPVMELESAASQMQLFDHMTDKEQLRFLEESIDGIEDEKEARQSREIAQAWRKADVAALDALAREAAADDTFSGQFVQKVLLEQRNPGLADGIAGLLKRDHDSMAAIGVLHLIGTDSVPELLRKRGLAVERIY